MKRKNSKFMGRIIFPCMITALVAVMFLLSCKKGFVETTSVKNDMAEAAKVLNGKVLSGSVRSETNENEIALNYNNGNKYIFMEKIQDTEPISINSTYSAELITSKYGVVLKDLSNNKIFLLTNNDSESIKMFEAVKSIFAKDFQNVAIFGITVVNAEKL